MHKTLILFVGVLVVVFVGIGIMNEKSDEAMHVEEENDLLGTASENMMDETLDAMATDGEEITMTAFYEMKEGKPAPQFSVTNITAKKGERVRIKVTNTKGMHDFTLDEYGIFEELPMNQEVVIQFTADKVGEFIYYCAKEGHRAAGQWGTLTVTE